MSNLSLANPYLTRDLSPPPPRSFRARQWCVRGYQPSLRPISPDSELGVLIGQMGWVGSHAHAHGYLWGSAGNLGALLDESIDPDCLLPYIESPRYALPRAISVPGLAGRRVLLTKSGARLDMISLEHPALNLAIVEVEVDGIHYRMRFGTQSASQLKTEQQNAPKPTSEMFHYMLVFDQLESYGFKALVHLQPKFLNLISRTEHGHPSRFYDFLKGYEPETPIMYEDCGGIGFVQERAPGIPELRGAASPAPRPAHRAAGRHRARGACPRPLLRCRCRRSPSCPCGCEVSSLASSPAVCAVRLRLASVRAPDSAGSRHRPG